jgi:nitroimidazol reductase NimA-like FMN-containing flavoprotein (pyridoxamine 5'-phosphate oxidase superfamily)
VTENLDDAVRLGRHPERGDYDFATVASIFDEALICHVGFVAGERPIVLPTIHARIDRTIYLHGSVLARWLKGAEGTELCVTATIVDALVLARSVFNHSMNYRSAVVIGTAELVRSPEERKLALEAVTQHVCPGRWGDARLPAESELAATIVVKVPIAHASAKIRSGPAADPQGDLERDVWAGLLPLRSGFGDPVPDPKLLPRIPVPSYLTHLVEEKKRG